MRDLASFLKLTNVLPPAASAITNNTAQVCNVIDTLGHEGLCFGIITGTLADTDATFTVLMEDGDTGTAGTTTLTDAATVVTAQLNGTAAGASFTFADDGKASKLGYVGNKRYVRVTVTPANNTGNAPMGVLAIQGYSKSLPNSTQVA